ncbi:hypothetical protein CPB85DRAFT_1340757, partial [Mucidula mucida]
IMSGMVQSKLRVHNGTVQESSLYYPSREEVERDRENDGSPAMTSKAWAKEVVSETLKSPTKLKAHFWIAPLSSVVWFANWFLPRTAFDSLFIKSFSLKKLERAS